MATLAVTIFILSYFVVRVYGGELQWGQGIIGVCLNFASQSLIMVSRQKENKRHRPWRPQIMAYTKLEKRKVSKEMATRYPNKAFVADIVDGNYYVVCSKKDRPVFSFAQQVKQGNGLVIGASVQNCQTTDRAQTILDLKELIKVEMREEGVDGLADVYVTKTKQKADFYQGISCLLQMAGIGSLRPNTLMMRFPGPGKEDIDKTFFIRTIQEAISLHTSLLILAQFNKFESRSPGVGSYIDAVVIHEGDTGLILMLAYLLQTYPTYVSLRDIIIYVCFLL